MADLHQRCKYCSVKLREHKDMERLCLDINCYREEIVALKKRIQELEKEKIDGMETGK